MTIDVAMNSRKGKGIHHKPTSIIISFNSSMYLLEFRSVLLTKGAHMSRNATPGKQSLHSLALSMCLCLFTKVRAFFDRTLRDIEMSRSYEIC